MKKTFKDVICLEEHVKDYQNLDGINQLEEKNQDLKDENILFKFIFSLQR